MIATWPYMIISMIIAEGIIWYRLNYIALSFSADVSDIGVMPSSLRRRFDIDGELSPNDGDVDRVLTVVAALYSG